MTLTVLFAGTDDNWQTYRDQLPIALAGAGLDAAVLRDATPETVDYIVYSPKSGLTDFTPFTQTKAVLSLWAGVETIIDNNSLTQPLARMVDEGLALGMRDWVCGHVLRHHLGMDAQIVNPHHLWRPQAPPLARQRRVGILGLGALGQTCAIALAGLGFDVAGWARSAKSLNGIACYDGQDGLRQILERSEILVLLLPHTAETEITLNCDTFPLLPDGAVVINPGRGALIDDDALLAALERNVAHATLDTFRIEPLPHDHPFWRHQRITVTPHIASETRPETASAFIAENIRRAEAGAPLLGLVDRRAGY
ncbi:2-hydroxyacid dehydrogenase [Aliiroseovarius sp. PTFE2010]|uniref:2-hydroxyacid dehydrogenase n=1 Tax=Aliiroseovarius sp. PTFE2010 TaxID=3417190 RepID=UPI003CF93AF8